MKSKVQEAEEPGSSSLQFLPSHPRYYPDSTDIATMARPSHQPPQPYSHLSTCVSDDMNSLPLLSFRMVPVDPLDSGFSDVKLTIFTLCPLLVEGFCAPRSQCGESTRRVVPLGGLPRRLNVEPRASQAVSHIICWEYHSQPPNPSLPPSVEAPDQAWSGNQVDVFIPLYKAGPKFPVL